MTSILQHILQATRNTHSLQKDSVAVKKRRTKWKSPKAKGTKGQQFVDQHGLGIIIVMGLVLKWSLHAKWKISMIELFLHGLRSGPDPAYFQHIYDEINSWCVRITTDQVQVEEEQERLSYSVSNTSLATSHKQSASMA